VENCWDLVCPTRNKNEQLSVHEAFQDIGNKLQYPLSMETIIVAQWTFG
jgi:hypothetical protein